MAEQAVVNDPGSVVPAPVATHGYGPYSNGKCKCDTCRTAKRERQRQLRAHWRALREAYVGRAPYTVPGITHGIGGYANFSCRCLICSDAKATADSYRSDRRRKRSK